MKIVLLVVLLSAIAALAYFSAPDSRPAPNEIS